MARINTFRTQNPFGSARHFVTVRNPGSSFPRQRGVFETASPVQPSQH